MNSPKCSAPPCTSAYGPPIQASKIDPVNIVVRRVEQLFAFADTMQNTSLCFALRASLRLSKFDPVEFVEQKANAALERVNNLTHKMLGAFCTASAPAGAMPWKASSASILAKAFKGELTEQWRTENQDLITGENSAEALLEKIKGEREAVPTKKKARTKKDA